MKLPKFAVAPIAWWARRHIRMPSLDEGLLCTTLLLKPDAVIGQHGHMWRWHLIPKNRFLNIYLHWHIGDDDAVLHDHPWHSVSVCLEGVLYEDTKTRGMQRVMPGQIRFRSAKAAHRLMLSQAGETAMTLFITGPRVRNWGFHCPKKWVPWQRFQETNSKTGYRIGCGEEE